MIITRRAALLGSAAVVTSALAACSSHTATAWSTSSGAATGPASSHPSTPSPTSGSASVVSLRSRAETVATFDGQKPNYWGFDAPGVATHFPTTGAGHDAVALTFDACKGREMLYNCELIAALRKNEAKATLMINMHWAQHNPKIFQELMEDPLFEIGSHGTEHLPLSVTGRSAYGEKGTTSVGGVWDELAGNFAYQQHTWGHRPRFMRAGTAFTDDVASRAADFAGQQLISFGTNGDAGATFPPDVVYQQVTATPPGSIVISHMNWPKSGTGPGYERALPALKARGLSFVHLSDVL